MSTRFRSQEGFGLVELLVSIVMLNIGILAIVAAFNSGALALKRAGEVSTASVIADKQMELYRALMYEEIALDDPAVGVANTDPSYQCDTANKDLTGACGSANQVLVLPGCATPLTPQCNPRQTVPGPDGRLYRVDTYVVLQPVPTGRDVKLVTIVIRRDSDLRILARVSSSFDKSSGE